MEFDKLFPNVSKDKFRMTANKLLNSCFLLKKNKDTVSDYYFILNNRESFIDYFEILGYEILIDEHNGVIGLYNPFGTGRISLKKVESILLLILRMLYIEKKKELSAAEDIIVLSDEIYDKYNMLKLNKPLKSTIFRNACALLKRYNLIQNLDSDFSDPDTRILIYPSIMFAVTNSSLEEIYQSSKEKLEKYKTGGMHNETDDEAGEDTN